MSQYTASQRRPADWEERPLVPRFRDSQRLTPSVQLLLGVLHDSIEV